MGWWKNRWDDAKSVDRSLLVQRISLFGVVASTATLSYSVLQQRAIHIGFPEWASLFYPLGLDMLILGASRVWTNVTYSDRTRYTAMGITLGAIVAGLLGFVAEFAVKGWIAVAFACLVPAALAASLILTSLVAADKRDATKPTKLQRQGGTSASAVVTKQVAAASKPSPGPTTSAPVEERSDAHAAIVATATADVRRAWIHEQLDKDVDVTGADVDKQFPGTGRNGARLVREVKTERENKETVSG